MTREQAEYDVQTLPDAIRAMQSMGTGKYATVESVQIRIKNVKQYRERLAKAEAFLKEINSAV